MSEIWQFFTPAGSDYATCDKCGDRLKRKGGSTKGLWTHHKTHPDEDSSEAATSSKRKNDSATPFPKKLKIQPKINTFIKNPDLGEILSKFAAQDGFSFHAIIESEGIQDYIRKPGMKMPKSSGTLAKLITEFYKSKKAETIDKIKVLMKDGAMFSISLDEWTDCQMRKYLNITLHTDDEDIVLGLMPVVGSCNAEKTSELVGLFLKDFDLTLEEDIIASCNDGAAVMVKYGKLNSNVQQLCYNHSIHNSVVKVLYVKKDPDSEDETDYYYEDTESDEDEENDEDPSKRQSKSQRMFFTDHDKSDEDMIEELSIRATLKETRRIVKFFKYSAIRKEILKKHVLKQEKNPLSLFLDCKTRWSTTLQMTKRFTKLAKPINDALEEIGQDTLPQSHFETLEITNSILSPAALVITELSKKGSNLLTAEGSLEFLFASLNDIDHPLAKELIEELKLKLLARRNKKVVSLLYFLHNGVYPKKSKFLDYSTKEEIKSFGVKLFSQFFEKRMPEHSSSEEEENESEEVQANIDYEKLRSSIHKVLNAKKKVQPQTLRKDFDQLEFSSVKSPRLTLLYKALLTIKPTSTASERVFSVSGLICTKIRNRLSPHMLNILVFLRYYFLRQPKKP